MGLGDKPEAYVTDVQLLSGKWEVHVERTEDDIDIYESRKLNPKDIPRDVLEAIHDFVVRGLG